jgi:hypothetical protein
LSNESEIRIYNSNIDSDLFLHIEDYDKNSEWVIQKSITHFFENNIFKMIDMNFIMFIGRRFFFINNVINNNSIGLLLFQMNYNKKYNIWQIKN